MRKPKINQRDELVRHYKTPSPVSYTELKSPRLAKLNNNNMDSDHRNVGIQLKYAVNKGRESDVFKAYLMQSKYRQNMTDSQIQNDINNKNLKFSKEHKFSKSKKIGKVKTQVDSDSYNPYFLKQEQVSKSKEKNRQSGSELSQRRSSINSKDYTSVNIDKGSYKETIHKLLSENIQLKKQFKALEERLQLLLAENKDISKQNNKIMAQLQNLDRVKQEAHQRQYSLGQQIKNLKKILAINTQQLSQSNYEIYKMKQQLFELHLNKERLQATNKLGNWQNKTLNESKQTNFGSSKYISSQTTIDNRNSVCRICKKNTATIIELNNLNQNLKYQLNEKDTIINSLCTEIQRLEGEIRLFEKAKFTFKRYSSMISQLSDTLMLAKAKELSSKYSKTIK